MGLKESGAHGAPLFLFVCVGDSGTGALPGACNLSYLYSIDYP